MNTSLQVWTCTKCAAIRSAPCGSVCLPADNITRESTINLAEHPSAHPAWVAYAVSQGYDLEIVEAMTTEELVSVFGVGL